MIDGCESAPIWRCCEAHQTNGQSSARGRMRSPTAGYFGLSKKTRDLRGFEDANPFRYTFSKMVKWSAAIN
jgi:hypothetical protein